MRKSSERKSFALVALCFIIGWFCVAAGENLQVSHAVSNIPSVFGNLTLPYVSFLDDLFYFLEDSSNVTKRCSAETKQLVDLARGGNKDALKIFDACGKPSSAILEGGIYFIGFYSECMNTVVPGVDSLSGKYCLITLSAKSSSHQQVLPQASWLVVTHLAKPPTVGICIPQSCSEADLNYAATASIIRNFEDVNASVAVCHTDVAGLFQDAGAFVTFFIFLVFITLGTFATAYDFVIERKQFIASIARESNKISSTTELCEKVSDSEPSVLVQILLSFSLKTNLSKILHVGNNEGITTIHGLRFLSMTLIILGHTFSFASQNLFILNPEAASQAPKDFVTQIFANGTLAVDTFYLISGLLVSYVTLRTMEKLNGKLPLLHFYMHRYFRLTPVFGVVILFCAFLLKHVSTGPNWLSSIQMYDAWCEQNGWLNVLYLHNFINTSHMCLSHSWYLATDMQMYLVAPLILIPLQRNLKYGVVSVAAFLITTIVITAVITAVNHYPAVPYMNNLVPLDVVNNYYRDVYIKPYCRIGPYIIGMAVGYFLLHKKELLIKKNTLVFLWCLNVALGLSVIYLMWPANQGTLPTNAEAAAYSSLARTVWGICLGWLVVACFYGYGGFINSILSWRPLVPLSRLTYCAYLIHPVVMNTYYGSVATTVAFSPITLLYMFFGNLCITYGISMFLSALFESPFINLEKILMSRKKS